MKKFILTLTAFLLVITPVFVTAATEEEQPSTAVEETQVSRAETQGSEVNVPVSVYSSTTLHSEDYFEIALDSEKGTITRTFSPANLMDETEQLLLPEGEYTVKSLKYLGANPGAIEGGFAITQTFTVSKTEKNGISFYIGQDNIEKTGEKEITKGSMSGTTEEIEETAPATEATTETAPENTTETTETTEEAAETTTESAPEATTEKEKAPEETTTEQKTKKKDKKKKFKLPIKKGIVFVAFVAILGVITAFWYKTRQGN